jgi:hypothetical protein
MSMSTPLTSGSSEEEVTRAMQLASEKLKAAKAGKKRLARKRAMAREQAASRQQDQIYYGYAALNAAQRRDRRPVALPLTVMAQMTVAVALGEETPRRPAPRR